MKVRMTDDNDLGWCIQYKAGRWPFWRTAFDRVLFPRVALALVLELRGRERLGDVQSELAHMRTSAERGNS